MSNTVSYHINCLYMTKVEKFSIKLLAQPCSQSEFIILFGSKSWPRTQYATSYQEFSKHNEWQLCPNSIGSSWIWTHALMDWCLKPAPLGHVTTAARVENRRYKTVMPTLLVKTYKVGVLGDKQHQTSRRDHNKNCTNWFLSPSLGFGPVWGRCFKAWLVVSK